jgi:hypothetical protein
MGFSGDSSTTRRHNTRKYTSHKITHQLKQNTAHKATQTIKDTLHTTNTTQKNPWPESANQLYLPSDLRLSAKLEPTVADRECSLVSVTDPYGRILGFLDRSSRSRGPGSIPGATRFSEKWIWNGAHSASWIQLRSYLEEKSSGSGLESRTLTAWNPLSAKAVTKFANKRRSPVR